MYISPLAVHCTSYCLDAFSSDSFKKLSKEEIGLHKSDIYELVRERVTYETNTADTDWQFLNQVTNAIINVLNRGYQDQTKRDAQEIITYLESCITSALKKSKIH